MERKAAFPKTLIEAIRHFSDLDVALAALVSLRWPDGVRCPHCQSDKVTFFASRRIWQCKGCRKQFSAKVGTIFEDSPLGLDKWLPAVWMIANDKNGISSYELHRGLGVTQKTAWFMLHRIRLAMQTRTFGKFGGDVEADEIFIGGRSRFMTTTSGSGLSRLLACGARLPSWGCWSATAPTSTAPSVWR